MSEETINLLLPLWCKALRRDGIAVTDDFFALGGTSLEGVQLLAEVSDTFGVEVPPLAMYDEASTPGGMAVLIDGELNGGQRRAHG
ncbi:phosphopantetheine-binding protein [Kibdelosporangium lantanae]|uniref:Phosphopantetheine-binding protein n=1 Tax=Kibdelosporangium lantanae TaxID=1497396 RepID=A0ABW3M907_9PSEU